MTSDWLKEWLISSVFESGMYILNSYMNTQPCQSKLITWTHFSPEFRKVHTLKSDFSKVNRWTVTPLNPSEMDPGLDSCCKSV